MKRMILLSVLPILLMNLSAYAATTTTLNRERHRYGLYGGFFSDPGGLLSLSAAAYVTRFSRLHFGAGIFPAFFDNTVEVYGGGVDFFPVATNLTPVLGVEFNYVHQDANRCHSDPLFCDDHGTRNSFASYGKFGIEWQASNGFNAAFGSEFYWKLFPIGSSNRGEPHDRLLPYLQFGWFF